MPIHLPTVSRRDFVKRSLVAGVGLVMAPPLLGAPPSVDEHAWALLSDPHLAGDLNLVFRGVRMADHFSAVSREIIAWPQPPAAVLINGDCAYSSGEKADYASLATLLQPLREAAIPIHLAVGNHDHRERFWEAFTEEKAASRPLDDRQTALIRTPLANWFILDSLEKTLSTPGLLGKEQLDWLARTLDQNPSRPAVVVIHHNPGLSGNLGLKDTLLLFEVIRPRKQVKAYIHGHTHTWRVSQDDSGIHIINLPAVSYAFTDGEPTGWVHSRLREDGIRLEFRCTESTHKAHGQVVNLDWRKSA